MRFAPLLLLLGCATSRPATTPACPVPPAVTPVAPVAATLDEAVVKARAHALFDAMDRADLPAATEALGPDVLRFETARFYPPAWILGGVRARIERHAPLHSRTWAAERVQLG